MNKKITTRDMIYSSLFTALIVSLSYVVIPLPFSPVPISGQSLGIILIGLVLTPLQAFFSTFIFIVLGTIGVPVFAGGAGGLQILVGPRGGYIVGFMLAAIIISWIRRGKNNFKVSLLLALFVGTPIIYVTGVFWMQHVTGFPMSKVLKIAMLPFIPGDIIKAIVAATIATRLNKAMPGR